MDTRKLRELLFPESQIGKAKREYGWVYKPDAGERIAKPQMTVSPIQPNQQAQPHPSYPNANQQAVPAYVPAAKRSVLRKGAGGAAYSVPQQGAVPAVGFTAPIENEGEPQTVTSGPTTTEPSPQKAVQPQSSRSENGVAGSTGYDEKFAEIRTSAGATFVGQARYLDDLVNAFKRPYVGGVDGTRPKNTLFVIGGKASGRHKSLELVNGALAHCGLGRDIDLGVIDLSRYPTAEDFKIFISDLYSALCSQASMVVFDYFDKCHATCIAALSALVIDGMYTFDARYIMRQDVLMDSTGTLAANTISELKASGKYFVFVTEKSEPQIADVFGARFMNAVGDFVHLGDYTTAEVREYCAKAINQLISRAKTSLEVDVHPDNTLLEICTSLYGSESGFEGIDVYLNDTIYKSIANYKLTTGPSALSQIGLTVLDGIPYIGSGGTTISLAEFMPRDYKGNIEEVKRELAEIIGLDAVKQYVLGIERNLQIQKMRKEAGKKGAPISMHMIFTGNPGTGKTTIARIVSKYLKALGVLSSGHLREVSRSDLVGQYVGHTATQTKSVIDSAKGGVLFIDEAYSLCRGENDTFGLEAIDTLVKCMEDNRDDLVVILAGYTNEMAQFLESNPGLKSRFPNTIEFPDYSAAEMLEIAKGIAKSKGYEISSECDDALMEQFERSQVKGRNDSGNGRLARNVVEAAILRQSQRLIAEPGSNLDELTYLDFAFEDRRDFDLEASLSGIVGLDPVKDFMRNLQQQLVANKKRRDAGLEANTIQSLNMIFSGNPGTGKTTVARIMAQMLKDMGYLKTGQLVEASRGSLVSEYAGGTAKKTEEVFRSALGGVLFVDEAYALAQRGDTFGQEAIDTLVKLIEDLREDVVVVLAGYRREMADFLTANSGLDSRFPIRIEFPDYNETELVQIATKMFDSKGFTLSDAALAELPGKLLSFKAREVGPSGNGRMVRNFVENVLRNQSARVASYDASRDELIEVRPEDLGVSTKSQPGFDLEAELSKVVGMEEVKQYVRSLQARLRMAGERKRLGLPIDETQTLHMVFTGNPGTGKTMMARTIARTLFELGVIEADKVIETDRAGLVAGYVGQTAIKTTEKFYEALGGVLFIDEAYALSSGSGNSNDFGKEVIDTLVKLIDDNRDRVVVILAGYTQDMANFLNTNPGLKSRFPNIIEFKDYSTDDLMKIASLFYSNNGYILTNDATMKLKSVFDAARLKENFGNGRYVRNVYERSLNNQAMRLSTDPDLTREELTTIEASDIEEVR